MTANRPPSLETRRDVLVLLADGDANTRRMYGAFLKVGIGWDVEEAADGRDALVKALSRRPDVIVTETRLPGLSGVDLCTLLRRDPATSTIPIIFVTGAAFDADIRRATRAGADAVLTKPCPPAQLLVEIKRVASPGENPDKAARPDPRPRGDGPTVLAGPARKPAPAPKRLMLNRAHQRFTTTEPPVPPPALTCPLCDHPLHYQHTQIGGVSARYAEYWHYFECTGGCGTFQYRARTRKLRKVS